MKRLLFSLVVLCCAVPAAMAGPNEGGVLWVHDTGILYTDDATLPPVSPPPADCAGWTTSSRWMGSRGSGRSMPRSPSEAARG